MFFKTKHKKTIKTFFVELENTPLFLDYTYAIFLQKKSGGGKKNPKNEQKSIHLHQAQPTNRFNSKKKHPFSCFQFLLPWNFSGF